jgi:hypothetical protein
MSDTCAGQKPQHRDRAGAGVVDGAQTAGEQGRVGPGIEFPNLRTPDVGRGRDPSEAVVGSEVSSGDAVVPMMESAEVRNRHDTLLGRRLERAWVRAVLVQRLMGARGIVVGQVSPQQPKEVSLVQDQEVVEALSPDRSDDPLDEGILPGCAWGDEHLTNPHPLDSPRELSAIDAIAITEQVRRSRISGEGLDDLPSSPGRRWMVRDVDVDEFTAVVSQDDEDEEQTEGEGRHEEEVDSCDVPGMSSEKGAPRGGRPRRRPVHVLGDGQFSDAVAEEGEFRLDAPAPPGGILPSHASDQAADLGVELGSADHVRPRLPPPVQLEALAVPGKDRGGLDDEEGGSPARPAPRQPNPEDPIP